MRAVVFHGLGDIRLDDVPDPKIKESTDAIVRLTASAICGTDLHMIRGTMPGMVPGTIMGHEGVGVVEEVGKGVRNFRKGDRIVIPSTIGCGSCCQCREGDFAQCDNANPNGAAAGTCFFGGPKTTGPIDGLQAEYARIPLAHTNMVHIPEEVNDDRAILVSDIFPTGYFGADLAQIRHGQTVAVFGCGPVGQFAIASAFYMGATRVLAVDRLPERLEVAQLIGAEVINFDEEDPVEAIKELTAGIGVDAVIDAVGVDAEAPEHGPAKKQAKKNQDQFEQETERAAPEQNPQGDNWHPGGAPSQALRWAIQGVKKAGTLSVIGVYPPNFDAFPIGQLLNKNLKLHAGNCNHRKYVPKLLGMMRSGTVHLEFILSHLEPMASAIDAYEAFDTRQPGWIKVELQPGGDGKASGRLRVPERVATGG